MAEFDSAWEELAQVLTDYLNRDDMNLNESYRGIVRRFYPDLSIWRIIDKLKMKSVFPGNLNGNSQIQKEVKKFYKQRFWDRLRADEILDQKIAEAFFNSAVEIGFRRTVRLLQQSLNIPIDSLDIEQELLVTGTLDEETWNKLQGRLSRVSTSLAILETFQVQKTVFDFDVARREHWPKVGLHRGRVFISYSRSDIAIAESFSRLLKREGWVVWWDQRMKAGVDLNKRIKRELRAAHCVIVLWSKNSKKSDWVNKEATMAQDLNTMLPIFIEDITPPTSFEQILGIKFLFWDGDEYRLASRLLLDRMNELARIRRENKPKTTLNP